MYSHQQPKTISQDSRSSDSGAEKAGECWEECVPPGAGPEGKARAVSLCVTQSAHETLALGHQQLTDQDLLAQRRSASESDV